MSGNKLIAKNTTMLFVRMALIMVVTLYTSRVLLQIIGVENFGIFNAVGSIVLIFSSISASMNAASNRFLMCELGREDDENMKKVFNAIFLIHLIVGVAVFFVIEIVGLYLFDAKMVIPVERLDAAKWVFHFSALSVVFLFMSYPFNSLIIAHEKMGAFAAISIIDALLRLAIVYLVSLSPADKLFSYGLLVLVVQVVIQLFYVVYCKIHFQETFFSFSFDKKLWLSMTKFMAWIFMGNVAYVGYTQGTNILLNMFFGPVVNASRAIAVQVQSAVTKFSDSFQTAIRPQITISYVQKDNKRMESLIEFGTRISFLLMSFIFVPLLFVVDDVLKLWLKEVPPSAGIFVIILMLVSMLRSLGAPLVYAMQANGDIRPVQIMESICLIMVLPVSYVMLKMGLGDATSVFLVCLMAEFCCYIGRIVIILPRIRLSFCSYLKKVILRISVFFITVITPSFLFDFFVDGMLFGKSVFSVAISLASLIFAMYCILFNSNERLIVYNYVKKVIKHV